MPQSLVKNYIHITFSTKKRVHLIDKNISKELYPYLAGICTDLESWPIQIGGYTDHIHILCMLSRKIPLMKLLEELKSHSSGWIKKKGLKYRNFYWQNGYGAFSVNQYGVEIVKRGNQAERPGEIRLKGLGKSGWKAWGNQAGRPGEIRLEGLAGKPGKISLKV
jgi:REP element-mobilizing transposase RayT